MRLSAQKTRLDHHLTRAASYQAVGEYRNALAACDQALFICPDSATAYHIRGLARYALGDMDEALRDWKQSDRLRRQVL